MSMVSYKILTLFPEVIESYINNNAPISRGIKNKVLSVDSVNFRNYSENKHQKVDDIVYGGGPGMLLSPAPLLNAIKEHKTSQTKIYFMDPRGKVLDNTLAKKIANESDVMLVCGRYEGFDERIFDIIEHEKISLGDFVLTGGELAAMAVLDASARFIPGSLDSYESHEEESFNHGWLEQPHYTRPRNFQGFEVPKVLFSGNHKEIEKWKLKNSIKNTIKNRPDLLKSLNLKDLERNMIKEIIKEIYDGHQCR